MEFAIVLLWLAIIFVTAKIAKEKNRSVAGWLVFAIVLPFLAILCILLVRAVEPLNFSLTSASPEQVQPQDQNIATPATPPGSPLRAKVGLIFLVVVVIALIALATMSLPR